VTIVTVRGAAPTSFDVTVDVPLEDPTLALLTWRDGHLVPLAPPPV